MQKSDTISSAMIQSAGKRSLLTADQELELARKLRRAKAGLWLALLSDPHTIKEALAFCTQAAASLPKRKTALDQSSFSNLSSTSAWALKSPGESAEQSMIRARMKSAIALTTFDPSMQIALSLFQRAKNRNIDERDHLRQEVYEAYLRQIEITWKRFVFYRNEFVEKNIRLVMFISKQFRRFEIPKDDLIQEGTFGLQKAAVMFDPDRGLRFSTYASWWIRAAIGRHCRDRGRLVRLPVNLQEKIERYYSIKEKLLEEGTPFDLESLSEITGLKVKVLKKLETFTLKPHYSMEYETKDGQMLGDLIPDPADPLRATNHDLDLDLVREMLVKLPARERNIIRARYGLDGGDGQTLAEIAEKIDLTRERVRQLETTALHKIRRLIQFRMDRLAMGLPAKV